ncbi:nucleotidyltransferase family protein [Brevibacterium casei]|uniref:Nicotine blue oxidoreductase n=1 Tax=Brevibacterium casei CIP 102111 TaxID=1255625 RepID=A0A2H1HJ95_9MICO|nr:nucleotidyltransferase family protein [Brevibacterium casei]MCT1551683.1 nucleotidyltransferase family protein [Brevibacterium casei]MCT1561187.1 nucleotidyltransferase family protein [Brevibacterium casei]MCT2209398.1 nucleotidyltransferase family protein [Brevibacterium casei]QPR38811.1 nucleotidyltransferase family protein [Brevibacterium casei]QPR42976.1 nucleotidyltransferase family protein [Brevibacterium casei]
MTPVALVLAAGSGRRLGSGPKALLPWEDTVLVVRAVRTALAAGLSPVVTAGPRRGRIVSHLAEAGLDFIPVVAVPDAESGMAASFRAGIDAISWRGGDATPAPSFHAVRVPSDDATPVVVMLVDQPGIGDAVLTRLCAHLDAVSGRVVRAAWAGAPGHPVVMTLAQTREAAKLAAGDEAGRTWMRRHRHLVDLVECSDIGLGADIDTPADLREWQMRMGPDSGAESAGAAAMRHGGR